MALAEAALEELGLAPVWVRRGIARAGDVNEDATGAAREAAAAAVAQGAQPVALDASREPAHRSSRDGGQDGARGGVADSAAFARDAADPARASTAPAPAARTGGDAGAAEPDEDMSWFDLEPVREPALPDVAAKPAAVTAGAEPSVAELGWDALRARVADCERCRLCEKRTNTVFGVGDESADWMLVGEAPGENEDKQGEPFVGQAGKLLDNMLRALALKRGENVYIANVIKCRPPGNRNPEPDEVARCEPYLQRQVALVKPKLIVALGRFAAQTLLKTDASIASMRGRVHRYEGVPVIVTYHPAYLLRSLQDKAKAWSDLCLANDTYRNAAPAADPQ